MRLNPLPVLLMLLAVSLTIAGCGRASAADAIAAVLRADKTSGEQAERESKGGAATTAAVRAHVSRIESIELTRCPPDFAEAYARHRAAWRNLMLQLQAEPQSIGEGLMQGLVNTLGGEGDGGYGRMTRGRQDALRAITDTWGEVEAIAARHGAVMPK